MQPEWARSPAPTPRSIFAARAFHLACGDSLRLGLRPKHDPWGHDRPQSREYRRIPDTRLVRGSAIALSSNIVRPPRRAETFGWRALSARSIFCRAARRPGSRRRLAALYIYAGNEKGSNGRAGAAVLGALSVQSLWGPTLFSLFTVYLLRADAALVGVALKLTRGGFDWHENVISTEGFTVGIYNDCSSFHNISLAALCWISLTKLHRPTFIRSDFKFRRGGLSRDDRAQRGAPLCDFARSRELRLLARWRRSADIRRDRVVRHRGDLRVGGFDRRREA